jgi:hypothetical protein
MSDIKLFRVDGGKAFELAGSALSIEKTLQSLIERNLDAILGIRFVASEHSTGKAHSGRIDTLGLDENGSPVILEYKRSSNENVINQRLFYLDSSIFPGSLLCVGEGATGLLLHGPPMLRAVRVGGLAHIAAVLVRLDPPASAAVIHRAARARCRAPQATRSAAGGPATGGCATPSREGSPGQRACAPARGRRACRPPSSRRAGGRTQD